MPARPRCRGNVDFVSDVLLLAARDYVRPDQREARLAFVTRWQQITGSIMAKGFEDTALYVYFPLASLNEVGGDPRIQQADPLAFHEFIATRAGKLALNGLGQTVFRVTCPGVPDCYQGSELWDLRLVDPDNRGPVDFAKRTFLLNRLHETANCGCAQGIGEMLSNWRDARVKLHVLKSALKARHENPELFLRGDYRPLEVTGDHKDRALAFARTLGNDWAVAVVARCVASLNAPVVDAERRGFWGSTSLVLPQNSSADWVIFQLAKAPRFQALEDACRLAMYSLVSPLRCCFPSTAAARLDAVTLRPGGVTLT